jgi:hypothetical protein
VEIVEADTPGTTGRADGRGSDVEHARDLTGLGAEGKSGRWLPGRRSMGDSDPKQRRWRGGRDRQAAAASPGGADVTDGGT